MQGFFQKKTKTKFLRNDGGQAKIHKIYEVHTLACSTCVYLFQHSGVREHDRACPCVNLLQLFFQ